MDLYLASAEPGLTLQEMIDFDIKCGLDFDTDPLVTSLDFSAVTSLEADFALRPFESLFDPLHHPDEEDDAMEACSGATGRPPSPLPGDTSPIASWMNLSAMTNFNLDAETSLMVNPSVVLPSPHHPPIKGLPTTDAEQLVLKREPTLPVGYPPQSASPMATQVVLRPIATPTTTTTTATLAPPSFASVVSSALSPVVTASAHTASTTSSSTALHTAVHHHHHHLKQLTTTSGAPLTTSTSAVPIFHPTISRPTVTGVSFTPSRSKPLQKYRRDRTPEEKAYPKPAYSYACLIALALKNSMTGSLPVSEIYSFMCEYFPYFRTAPNGWKNSVRHNLSLNKCFEKIEKPVVSGSNQRKGCLWALNPLKAHKMDEEVQKWSKKDLQGIRDAMTCPEVLENLERGEMKFESSSGASSCSEDEEDEDTTTTTTASTTTTLIESLSSVDHATQSPIKVISSGSVGAQSVIANGLSSRSVTQHEFLRSSPKPVQLQDLNLLSGTVTSTHHGQPQQIVRRRVSSSPESEFALPDSTMSEINIQSNGALIDDFGNEITLEGDLSILNPRVATVSSAGGANLILKKVNASPLRNASSVKSNFMYSSASSASATPLLPHHQNGLANRMVLTNAKLS